MSVKRNRRIFGWEVTQFRHESVRPKKFIGTWSWAVGDSDGFCFFVEAESHKRNYKAKTKPYRGPIIATRAEAIRQAKAKAAELQSEWDAKQE